MPTCATSGSVYVHHGITSVLAVSPSGVIGPSVARDLVRAFLGAEFNGGERYVRRLQKIEDLERAMTNA